MSPFHTCSYLKTIIGLDTVDTSQVTNFDNCFRECALLETIDCSSFDTSNATSINSMFWCQSRASTTKQIIGVENFNTSKVTNMTSVFRGQAGLTSLDLSKWKTNDVTIMNGIFWNCKKLTSLNLTGWNTSKVTDFSNFFNECNALEDFSCLDELDMSAGTSFSSMFYNCKKLSNITMLAYYLNSSNMKITEQISVLVTALVILSVRQNLSTKKCLKNIKKNI
jgi:surface protein